MKKLSLLQLLAIAVLMTPNCATDDVAKDDVEAKPGAGIIVDLPEWTYTKANDMDVLYPELEEGDTVAVLNEEGIIYPYTVVKCDKHAAVLENPDVELVEGAKYRVQSPLPVVGDSPFMLFLYFGDYYTESVNWLVSDWKKFKKDETLHLKFSQPGSVLAFDVTAPFDCVVDEVRLHTDECIFCIKGAFDATKDKIFPERTTWNSSLRFPQRGMVWEKGKVYKMYITVWPEQFSKEDYSLDIYTEDDRGASAVISLPDVKAGEIVELDIKDFEILVPPVAKKDVLEHERYLDEVRNEGWHPGELW